MSVHWLLNAHPVSRGCAPDPLLDHGSFLAAVDQSLRSLGQREAER